LVDADAQLEKLITDTGALGTLLEQNLLWVPSHPPVSGQWTTQASEQWQDLVKPSRWQAVFKRVANRLPEKPLWIIGLLLPIVLILLRPLIDRQLADLASRLRNVRQDRYRYTMHALLLTMLRATPMMLFSLWAGHILQSVGDAGRFTHSLGQALWATAPHIYFFTLIVAICRDQGLAQAHLRWPRTRRTAILYLRPYLYAGVLPLLWLASVCFARDLDTVNGTLLRPVLMLLHLTLAGFSWWLPCPCSALC
jgi:potassium efflux system protein